MSDKIHYIAFDNPYPPNYGGAIDVFNKIVALHESGLKIYLHLFIYGDRITIEPLHQYCHKIYTYSRKTSPLEHLSSLPYIVASRRKKLLLKRLKDIAAPIFMEGLHCTAWINKKVLKNRKKIVRAHNIEHEYYNGLAASADGLKKIYYRREAKKLKKFEKKLQYADHILSIAAEDQEHFGQFASTAYLPAFHNTMSKRDKQPKEPFALFHGNLAVEENERAALYLIHEVLNKGSYKTIIAGQNPSNKLKNAIQKNRNLELIENPYESKMEELISRARCHVFYSHQATGIKLKLIHALFSDGHIVMNSKMAFNQKCYETLNVVNHSDEMSRKISSLMESTEVKSREKLCAEFDNQTNASIILNLLRD